MIPDFPEISRDEFRRIDEKSRGESGEFAARLVAAHYGATYEPDDADWYDVNTKATGTKYEVKSTHTTIDGENPGTFVGVDGRFRVWKDQLRSLIQSDAGDSTAWVVFVVFNAEGTPLEARKMKPSTVWKLVQDEFDGFDISGHISRTKQQKIPIDALFS